MTPVSDTECSCFWESPVWKRDTFCRGSRPRIGESGGVSRSGRASQTTVLLTSVKSEFPDLAILSVHCEILMYCLFQIVILMLKVGNIKELKCSEQPCTNPFSSCGVTPGICFLHPFAPHPSTSSLFLHWDVEESLCKVGCKSFSS